MFRFMGIRTRNLVFLHTGSVPYSTEPLYHPYIDVKYPVAQFFSGRYIIGLRADNGIPILKE